MHHNFEYRSRVPASVHEAFSWHERPGAFERLLPPWAKLEVVSRTGDLRDGQVKMAVGFGPVNTVWTVQHKDFIQDKQFYDHQVEGPMEFYEQIHGFEPESEVTSFLHDVVNYELPGDVVAQFGPNFVIQNEFKRLFEYRHQVVADDLRFAKQHNESKPMKIAVTGSTGFVGSALVPFLTTQGHEVVCLVRPQSRRSGVPITESAQWDPAASTLDPSVLEGCDAVVHLAGDNIGTERWNEEKKERMRLSRMKSTQLLCDAMAKMSKPPSTFLCASAIGYYGDRGSDLMTEDSQKGTGYLADLCEEWEQTAKRAEKSGVRVCNLRIGVVLSPKGGALQKMMLPFQMGGGGVIGSGTQYFSWIALDDVIGSILHCLLDKSLTGPVNAVAPNAVTNAGFTHAFGRVIQRPTVIPMPAFAARLAFGEFADECLLASSFVVPDKLLHSGYNFRYPEIEGALRHVLGRETLAAGSHA